MTPKLPMHKPVLSPEEIEIRAWLKLNRETLMGREPGEVAYLAVLVGFVLDDVTKCLSNFADAMQGSYIDNRAAFEVWRLEMVLHRMQPKELDLSEQWKELAFQTTQKESEE